MASPETNLANPITAPAVPKKRALTISKKILFWLTAASLSTLLPLLLFEIGLRVFPPDWLSLRMREMSAGKALDLGTGLKWPIVRTDGAFRSFTPHSSFRVRHREYDTTASIDEWGGRVIPTHGRAVPPNPRVLVPFVGDSFTFGVGVEDDETYVALLAKETPCRLINLGVPGTALDQHIDMIRVRHEELGKPRVYVLNLFLGNDLADILRRHKARPVTAPASRSGNSGASRESLLYSVNDLVHKTPLLRNLYSVQFVRQKVLWMVNRNSRCMNPVFLMARTDTTALTEAVRCFEREVKRLQVLAAKENFKCVFVLLPDVYQVKRALAKVKAEYYGLDPAKLDMLAPNRVVTAVLKRLKIPFLDITAALSSHADRACLYYVQDNHFTREGHLLVARTLAERGLFTLVAPTKGTE